MRAEPLGIFYVDICTPDCFLKNSTESMMKALNQVMVEGVEVLSVSDDQFVRMIRRLARLLLLLEADSSAKPVGAASHKGRVPRKSLSDQTGHYGTAKPEKHQVQLA